MKKMVVIALSALSLMGCKSLESVRSKPPVNVGSSNKSVSLFSSCVSNKWAGNGPPVTSLPLENGISILVPQSLGGYDVVLDVTKKESGSSYVLYERIPSLTSALYEKSVMDCAKGE